MIQEGTEVHNSVQFSRTQGFFSATALSGSVVIALGLFVARTQVIGRTGSDAPLVFIVAAFLFLPFIFSCVQRSSAAISGGGFYSAAKASGSAFRLFLTVWLMLGGYVSLAGLLLLGAATRVNVGLERVFGMDIGMLTIVLLILAIAFIKEIISQTEAWRARTLIFWVCILTLILIATASFISNYTAGVQAAKTEAQEHWLLSVSMLCASLWGVDVVLNSRRQFRKPYRTILWSLIAIFFGGSLFISLVVSEILRNPSLLIQNWVDTLTWEESRLELLILTAGLILCLAGLFRALNRITRLLGAMILDGALPKLPRDQKEGRAVGYYLALSLVLIAYLTQSISTTYLLSISAFAVLLSLILYLQPLLKKDVSRTSEFVLPFHPLIPALSILLSIFLLWILPLQDLLVCAFWLLIGGILYFGNARKKMLPAMQKNSVLAAQESKFVADVYRVLVCLEDHQINENLIRVGTAIAAAKKGEVLVLRIMETSEQLPLEFQRRQGEAEWMQIKNALPKNLLPGVSIVPVVRIAPDFASGVRATSREFEADLLLLEWPQEPAERLRRNQLQSLLRLSSKPIGILKGTFEEKPEMLSVACGNNEHSILALQIGEAIATSEECSMELMKIFPKSESEQEAEKAVESSIHKSGLQLTPKIVLRQSNDVESGILKETEDSSLLLIGASSDPLSGVPLPDGLAMDVGHQRKAATLITKSREEKGSFVVRSLLSSITSRVTSLTPKERSELMGHLRVGLQARTDFYLMVALAAAIAITGLIMNDGSIVLGAMLVSPLMSPIVGIACGIALGNLDLIRRSSGSTFKGMTLVLGVGIVMSFILPTVEPTDQILSRTHPGIFDLLAALAAGAAGAYSLGKKSVAGAIPGVAMSLSLEPPLATAGFGISTSQFWIAGGAFLLFLTNLAAIVLSGVVVYLLLGMRPPRKEGIFVVGRSIAFVSLITCILVIPLGFGTYGSVQKGHLKYQIESQFRDEALLERFELLNVKISEDEHGFLIQPTVLASEEVTTEKIEKFRKVIEQKVGLPIQIEATILQTIRIDSPSRENTEKN